MAGSLTSIGIGAGLLLVGICGLVAAEAASPGRQKVWFRFGFTLAVAGAFCWFGAWRLARIKTSAHVFVQGNLTGLTQRHGKDASSIFWIENGRSAPTLVRCDYAGDHLMKGGRVSVETLEATSTLLRLRVEDGRFAGWELKEGDGTMSSAFAIALGRS